jgi:hypothetical protein
MSYFNTTHETGQTLVDAKAKAKTQDELIMDFFKGGAKFTPWGVYSQLLSFGRISNNVPITSIRRSISNLCSSGYLVKLNEKRRERLGVANYLYQKAN